MIDAYPHLSVAARAALLESPWTKGNKNDENQMFGSAKKRAGKLVASRALQFDTPKKMNSSQDRIPLSLMDINKDSSPNQNVQKRTGDEHSKALDIGKRKRLSYPKPEKPEDKNVTQLLLTSYSSQCDQEEDAASRQEAAKMDKTNVQVESDETRKEDIKDGSLDLAATLPDSASLPESELPPLTIDELLSIAQPTACQAEVERDCSDRPVPSIKSSSLPDETEIETIQEYSLLVTEAMDQVKNNILLNFTNSSEIDLQGHGAVDTREGSCDGNEVDELECSEKKMTSETREAEAAEEQNVDNIGVHSPSFRSQSDKGEWLKTVNQNLDGISFDLNTLKTTIDALQSEKRLLQNKLEELEAEVSKTQNSMMIPNEEFRSLESRYLILKMKRVTEDSLQVKST